MKPYATHLLSFVLFFFWTSLPLSAQEKMEVSRARAIDFGSKVLSISVDQENNKWVSTDQGLFQVKSPDLSIPVAIPAGSSALYQFPGGNADFSWKMEELNNALGRILSESNTITAAAYDSRKNILWIGTSESGVYEVQTKPALKVLGKVNNNGPKSGAAKTNALLVDALGRTWIGTDAGSFMEPPVNGNRSKSTSAFNPSCNRAATFGFLETHYFGRSPTPANGNRWIFPLRLPRAT
ncbi:MAG: hypothetical protein IPN74_11790 [Haliscomenobacter sp.]|nr:hypothetical protein [Haliscomenobacter sp.]